MKKSMEAADGISNRPSHLPNHFPQRQRSNRRVVPNKITNFFGNKITKENPSQLHLTAPPCGGARQKRSRKVDEETNDSEQTYPISLRSRGLPKTRANCNNAIKQQQGKMNSNTLEFYLENLWRGFPEESRSSFAYFDSLWYSLYTKETYKEKVLNWIKKKNIFSKKYVFVPIVQWGHWNLLIFCHFGENMDSKTRTPCMLLLDSLQMANPEQLEPGIRKFVLEIYKSEGRPEDKKFIYKIPFLIPKVPQQRNGEECGNFVLFYMNQFLESAPENFSISDGYPYFMNKNWFSPEELECFCKRLETFRELIPLVDDW